MASTRKSRWSMRAQRGEPLALGLLFLLALPCACGNSDAGAQDAGKGDAGNDGAGAALGQAEFEALRASLGPLQTLAGIGKVGNDTNDWKPAYEGAQASAVELSTPHNAAGDDAGNIFIADKDAHAIRKVSPDGVISTVAGVNLPGDDGDEPGLGTALHLTQPNGLWVRGDGTVYILDLGNAKIRKLDVAGQLSTLFTVPGLGTGRGLWVADDETSAYVSGGSVVWRWTPAQGVQRHADGFLDTGNLYVTAAGVLYVTDRGANRVFRVSATGVRVPLVGSGAVGLVIDGSAALDTALHGVRGVWPAQSGGGFLLATHEGNQVLYLDSYGFVHVLIDGARGAHSGDGQPLTTPGYKVSEVRSVGLSPAGDLLVVENDFGFVRIARRAPAP